MRESEAVRESARERGRNGRKHGYACLYRPQVSMWVTIGVHVSFISHGNLWACTSKLHVASSIVGPVTGVHVHAGAHKYVHVCYGCVHIGCRCLQLCMCKLQVSLCVHMEVMTVCVHAHASSRCLQGCVCILRLCASMHMEVKCVYKHAYVYNRCLWTCACNWGCLWMCTYRLQVSTSMRVWVIGVCIVHI